jgi:uncharacterized protein (TIGR03790 family)
MKNLGKFLSSLHPLSLCRLFSAAILFSIIFTWVSFAEDGSSVLVVVNDVSPASVEVGKYYASKRHVPEANICHIRSTNITQVDLDTYKKDILPAIKQSLKGGINYILMTFGTPFKLQINGSVYCLDSFLCFPNDTISATLEPAKIEKDGRVKGYMGIKNPYFKMNGKFSSGGRSFMVTRLDAATKNLQNNW